MNSLAILLCAFHPGPTVDIDWNFEDRLGGWTIQGAAFANQPTRGNNIAARLPNSGFILEGNHFVGTFENRQNESTALGTTQGDGPTGTLTSLPVTLSSNTFSCLLGGGQDLESIYIQVLIKATPENRTRFEVDPKEPDTGRSVPYRKVGLSDGEYYEVLRETGRNAEVMRRVSTTMPYVRAGDVARVRIVDVSSGPWGHINVDDIRIGVGGSPTTLAGRVHVSDQDNAHVPGAEVFVNGELRGVTNSAGMASCGIVRPGDRLVARKRIFEERTYRAGHAAGSGQNWKYRVYLTSLVVGPDGSANAAVSAGDPSRIEELRVLKSNALIGLNLNVSVEHDADTTEVNLLRQLLVDMSSYLYNATDGQFMVEHFNLRTNGRGWENADFRVHADQELRPHCDIPFGFFDPGLLPPGLMHMPRPEANWGGGAVYAHEFGHYGFGLFDEYLDVNPNVQCTASLASSGPYGARGPQAACMMYDHRVVSKLCSNVAANPHASGTLQGFLHTHDCWTSITDTYGRSLLYGLKSPNARGVIPGRLPDMPAGWRSRFTEAVNTMGDYRGRVNLTVTDSAGNPKSGVGVWLRTSNSRSIFQGDTNDRGQITVLGCHPADVIRYDGRQLRVSDARSLLAMRGRAPSQGGAIRATIPSKAPRILAGAEFPMGQKSPLFVIGVENGKLDDLPVAEYQAEPGSKVVPLRVVLDPGRNAYTTELPANVVTGSVVSVSASVGGERLVQDVMLKMVPSTGDHLDLYSPDGMVVIRASANAVAKGERILSSKGFDTPPENVVAGPYSVSSTGKLGGEAVVSFRMGPSYKPGDPKSHRIMRREASGWVEVPGVVYGADLGTFAARIDRWGCYALVRR